MRMREEEPLEQEQEAWRRDSAGQVTAQSNLSATTATTSHVFLDSCLGHRE